MKLKHNKLSKMFVRYSVLMVVAVLVFPSVANALTAEEKQAVDKGNSHYKINRGGNGTCGTSSSSEGVNIDQLLRTIAKRESGGNPKAQAATSSASGKYQYIDGTWRSRASLYSEVSKYAHAKDAPEEVQDAVAYLEYTEKIKTYKGDLFKMALSHFLPAAISDESLLDVTPPGNSITPRQYAEAFVEEYKGDVGKDIKLYYDKAPNLPTAVPTPGGSSSSGGSCELSTDTADLGAGKGSYTDSGEVKDFANVLANSKASDKEFGNGFVGCNVCAAVVSRVWRGQDIGYGINAGTDGAIGMWTQYGSTVGHADRKPKRGAILLYESRNPAGHVVIYLGNNKVLNDGQIMDANFENSWGITYKGWIDPNDVGWTSKKAGNIRTALASKLSRICN